MGQILKIEHDEAVALADEWAALTGEAVGPILADALRASIEKERARRKWVADMMVATDEFAELMENPPPGSDHSWLYDDETGLPI